MISISNNCIPLEEFQVRFFFEPWKRQIIIVPSNLVFFGFLGKRAQFARKQKITHRSMPSHENQKPKSKFKSNHGITTSAATVWWEENFVARRGSAVALCEKDQIRSIEAIHVKSQPKNCIPLFVHEQPYFRCEHDCRMLLRRFWKKSLPRGTILEGTRWQCNFSTWVTFA